MPVLLADSLSSSLSVNAQNHLRAARISRHPEHTLPRESLRIELLRRGFSAPEPLLDLEARAGGSAFPRGRLLGAACFLEEGLSLRPRDLPSLAGEQAFPIYGVPVHLEEWETAFFVMAPSGAIGLYGDLHGPTPAYGCLEHLLEIEALAPFSNTLHVVRVDAFCGEAVAGLVGALPHDVPTGEHVDAWVGSDAWVKESRLAAPGEEFWSSYYGTFLLTDRTDLAVDVMSLLLEQGFSLGYKGPDAPPPAGESEAFSFIDSHPELGYRARVKVTVWGGPGHYAITRETE